MSDFPQLPDGQWSPEVYRAYEFLRDAVQQGQELLSHESSDAIRYRSAAEQLSPYPDFRNPLVDSGLPADWADSVIAICSAVYAQLQRAGDEALYQ
jgi:hypothetical protein